MKKSIVKIICIVLCVALLSALCVVMAACDTASDGTKVLNMVNVELSSEQYAFAFNPNNTALKDQINSLMESKSAQIEAIKTKYFEASAEELDEFGFEVATESSNPDNEFIVATELGFAPFEYVTGSKLAGIDIEIAKLFADSLGKTLVVKHMEFDAVLLEIAKDNTDCDIAMAGLTVTPERAETMLFSNTYYDTTQVIITSNDLVSDFDYCTTADEVENVLKSLKGDAAKCGGQRATTGQWYIEGDEVFEFEGFANLTFVPYSKFVDAINDMLNGQINFIVIDKAVAITYLKQFNA